MAVLVLNSALWFLKPEKLLVFYQCPGPLFTLWPSRGLLSGYELWKPRTPFSPTVKPLPDRFCSSAKCLRVVVLDTVQFIIVTSGWVVPSRVFRGYPKSGTPGLVFSSVLFVQAGDLARCRPVLLKDTLASDDCTYFTYHQPAVAACRNLDISLDCGNVSRN